MNLEFYHLKDFIHFDQPTESNWCWAACLNMMLSHFTPEQKKPPCRLVVEYLEYLKAPIANKKFCDDYRHNRTHIPSWLNRDMDENDLADFFNLHLMEVRPLDIDSTSPTTIYQEIIQYLKNNKLPILHKEFQGVGKAAHLRLITGYGNHNGCSYILVSNPFDKKAEYEPIDLFAQDSLKFWSCKPKVPSRPISVDALIKDSEIENAIVGFSSRWLDYEAHNDNGIVLNPLIVFHQDYKVVEHFLKIDFDHAVIETFNLLKYMSESSSCNVSIPKTSVLEKLAKSIKPFLNYNIDYILQKMNQFNIQRNVIRIENIDIEINKIGQANVIDSFQFNMIDESGLRDQNNFLKWDQLTNFLTK